METIKESLDRYAKDRIPPGGFLTSVLENDLMSAVARADFINSQRLPEICKYVYNNLPSGIWGSKEIVQSHLKRLLNIGDKVYYQPGHYKDTDEYENGMVKEIPDHTNTSIRVVYNCAGDWDNFKNYTSALTNLKDLALGWKHE